MQLPTIRQLTSAPNLMSLVRVPMGALVWLFPHSAAWVLGLMLAAGLSDVLDGRMARARGLPPDELGAWLDPLCDKAFVASAFVAVWWTHDVAWWLALLAAARELILLPLVVARFLVPSLRERHFHWKARALGKATTVAQFALFSAVLLGATVAYLPLSLLCGALGSAAGLQYGLRARTLLKARPTPPAPPPASR